MAWATVCELEDLAEGIGKMVEIDGYELAIFLHGGAVYATDNRCPHAGGSMAGGWIDAGCAVCPWHAWAFDLKTGALRGGLADAEMLRVYPTRIEEHAGRKLVQVDLPKRGGFFSRG